MPASVTQIPGGFWPQINHQLQRISSEKPDTFDGVRAILLDADYDQITAERNRNGVRVFLDDCAFFAGSGGDATLSAALEGAGWQMLACQASYYYAMVHEHTGETLTYIEGDVKCGSTLS